MAVSPEKEEKTQSHSPNKTNLAVPASVGMIVNLRSYNIAAEDISKMTEVATTATVKAPKGFTDVLYLTNQEQMPPEIKRLLKQKKLSFLILPIHKFNQISDRLDFIGTVIIDVKGLDSSPHQKLARIIESLEMKNISSILLKNRNVSPVKSFALTDLPVKSFSLTSTIQTFSIDQLWGRISVNLAHRKSDPGVTAKPNGPSTQSQDGNADKLAEQLSITETLVDNLSEQLRMAGLIQRDFLPVQPPNSDKIQWGTTFLPAERVSGDIYDIVRVDERHIGFYVADVVGHGIPAALLTIFIKQALVMRQTIGNDYHIFPPAEVMSNLNHHMTEQKLSGYLFATCCYCLLNTETLQLTWARAGHPYPILIKADQQPQQLETRGSLLGIFEQAEYVQQTIQLQRGDKLLLYSDGAEYFIGSFDNSARLVFNKKFCEIMDLPIAEMMSEFNKLILSEEIEPSEVDDITAVGLEIL